MFRAIVLVTVLLALGCASIVSKSTYPVTLDSNPSGAKILVTDHSGVGVYEGATPTTLTLSAKRGFFQGASYTIKATKEGYNPGQVTLNSGLDGWYIGNLLFGGLIGLLIVDPATGAMWTLDSHAIVNLGARSTSNQTRMPQLRIVTIDEISPDVRDSLIAVDQPRH